MNKLSIKMKITLWYTILMIIIVILILSFMFSISGTVIKNDVKKNLQRIINNNADEIEFDDGKLDIDDDYIAAENHVLVYLYSPEGQLIDGMQHSITVPPHEFINNKMRLLEINEQDYYVLDKYISIEGYGNLWLRGICLPDKAAEYSLVGTIFKLAFIALPFFVLFASIGGYQIAKRSFRPIEQINQAAEEITEGSDLSKRIGLVHGENEIYHLANTFDRMFDRLETSFYSERQFTSDASHELRTPVSVILSQCEYALETERAPDEYIETLETIERQGYKMSRLISQLLTFTRLEQGTQSLKKEPANLGKLISEICDELAELKIHNITLNKEIANDININADVLLITRLATNLIKNAYIYGIENGYTNVSLKEETDHILFSVSDNGIGISEENMAHIWKRFYQVNPSRNTSSDGMGLGLSMVKQIAELHGGSVHVTSNLGKGSTFTVFLPKD